MHAWPLLVGDRVADPRIRHLLDRGGEESDLTRPELVGGFLLGAEDTHPVDQIAGIGRNELDPLASLELAIDHPHQHHHSEIGVVPGIDEQRLERRAALAFGRRQALHDGLQHLGDAIAGLGRDFDAMRGIEPDHVLDLLAHPLGLRRRQVNLVEDRHDLVIVVDRLIDIGERLGLDPLARIDDQQRSFQAASERLTS